MALLFAHEATRVFHDRLVAEEDRQFFYDVLADKIDLCIRCKIPVDTFTKKTLIFGDFSDLNNPKADRVYRQIKDVNLLSRTLQVSCYVYIMYIVEKSVLQMYCYDYRDVPVTECHYRRIY